MGAEGLDVMTQSHGLPGFSKLTFSETSVRACGRRPFKAKPRSTGFLKTHITIYYCKLSLALTFDTLKSFAIFCTIVVRAVDWTPWQALFRFLCASNPGSA